MIAKTQEEIEILREGGKRLATILHKVSERVAPGVSALDLDRYARELIKELGDESAFLGYTPEGVKTPYPAALCVSVNDEVVHGIPTKDKVLKEGDIVAIDLGLKHRGLFTDMAMSVPVGKINNEKMELLKTTETALQEGIWAAKDGGSVGDIGHAVEQYIKSKKKNYGIVEILAGHGVGRAVHEDPYVPNYGKPGTGEKLVTGMVIAIEPMVNLGTKNVTLDNDEYTFRTADGKASAHFEHTILITENGPEILTKKD